MTKFDKHDVLFYYYDLKAHFSLCDIEVTLTVLTSIDTWY